MNQRPDYSDPVVVEFDAPAVLIPEGTPITLTRGTPVFITQALGGSVTVNVGGNLARVSREHVTALGMEPQTLPSDHSAEDAGADLNEALVWEMLATCYDPEIPINIVELGLIYKCESTKLDDGHRLLIEMTLTAPGCGMGPFLVEDVRAKLLEIPNVREVEVDLVFDPPWNPEMMSEAARLETGML